MEVSSLGFTKRPRTENLWKFALSGQVGSQRHSAGSFEKSHTITCKNNIQPKYWDLKCLPEEEIINKLELLATALIGIFWENDGASLPESVSPWRSRQDQHYQHIWDLMHSSPWRAVGNTHVASLPLPPTAGCYPAAKAAKCEHVHRCVGFLPHLPTLNCPCVLWEMNRRGILVVVLGPLSKQLYSYRSRWCCMVFLM